MPATLKLPNGRDATDEDFSITHAVLQAYVEHLRRTEPYAVRAIEPLDAAIEALPQSLDDF